MARMFTAAVHDRAIADAHLASLPDGATVIVEDDRASWTKAPSASSKRASSKPIKVRQLSSEQLSNALGGLAVSYSNCSSRPQCPSLPYEATNGPECR